MIIRIKQLYNSGFVKLLLFVWGYLSAVVRVQDFEPLL